MNLRKDVPFNKRKMSFSASDVIIFTILSLFFLISLYPFYNMLIMSFARFEDVARPGLYIWPKYISFINYQVIFSDPALMRAFGVSFFIAVAGTSLAMFVTTTAAYALSKKVLPGRKGLMVIYVITMYFSGGLIPWYLVLRDLGFVDNILVMIIPSCFSVFSMILMRNYFNSIPDALEESAKIDGANDIRILVQIILPVAKPILATITLFYAVAYWNEWWHGMLFIVRNTNIQPLQLLLRRIVVDATVDLGNDMRHQLQRANVMIHRPSIQMASVTVATIPIMLVYPFVQKHFAKGIMLGSVKA